MTEHHGDALRPGETALDLPAPNDARLRFIGRLRTPFAGREECPRQGSDDGPECRVELSPEFAPGLDGIEAFSRVELLYWLHEARRDLLTQSPKGDGAVRGTFSLRSPLRPNPIGTSVVRLIRREGAVLVVRGLDCLDGTPLVDIKPVRCEFTVQAAGKGV
ncbi:tRNA (N6-threonylcarbamoyladenosine(37)-N6)-methyltransferase TrmO [Tropicibacter naphthalenivorans]|uniref:S-adenosyl-L-methionine-binding protein n=1 Tax=Tropicibacter naphthalenivorans TaxID=441103 RepID=A0A0P1GJK5_9RHOB|nr:tRNA (N6-threonylcarbamoyladenosine(37)-N6)-methyltransferase TrmO [Tropicibacter naphthalenivorans]CUH75678.1 S-adenosyl-L-methionine-binding protein [Tropicibacter naphthalenivorans]SMC42861.1 tRNA-Thr(GGU) m(6)t(6)A37 methyltransferase TsaA [Tropicibacter naphthalenivorans]